MRDTFGKLTVITVAVAATWFLIGPTWVWCIDELAGALLAANGG